MPYINSKSRIALQEGNKITEAGELNYQLTVLLNSFIKENGLNYSNINTVLGALEGAKLEFYRRIAVPYENGKMAANGDVYDL